jgi:acetoin utilization deacetylase AcuC-like enzyme
VGEGAGFNINIPWPHGNGEGWVLCFYVQQVVLRHRSVYHFNWGGASASTALTAYYDLTAITNCMLDSVFEVGDAEYMAAFNAIIIPIIATFQPEVRTNSGPIQIPMLQFACRFSHALTLHHFCTM